jgi:hypothetical protein
MLCSDRGNVWGCGGRIIRAGVYTELEEQKKEGSSVDCRSTGSPIGDVGIEVGEFTFGRACADLRQYVQTAATSQVWNC